MQPDKEVHRARTRSTLSARASVLVEMRCATLRAHGCLHLESPRIFMEVLLCKHDCGHWQQTQSAALPSTPEVGGMRLKIPRFESTLDFSGNWLLP